MKKDMTAHIEKHRRIYLTIILLLCLVIRFRFLDLCDVGDRGQVVLGMTNNLPPLFHYISLPFLYITDNLWYSPAFANLAMAVLSAFVVYLLGRDIKSASFGLLLAFLFSIYPTAVLTAREISPEQAELFFVILISYLFIRLEVIEKKEHGSSLTFLYFLALAIGAFSKQQTLSVLFPIFFFGLYKHRLRIFRKEIYYISAFAALPYILFLIAHPEMLAAIKIYFVQPTGQLTITEKSYSLLLRYVTEALPYIPLLLLSFLFFVRKAGKKFGDSFSDVFICMFIFFVFYNLFLIKTLPHYFHLLVLPIIYFSGEFLFSMKRRKFLVFCLLFVYCLVGFYFIVPGWSINTLQRCEHNIFGVEQNFIYESLGFNLAWGDNFFQVNGPLIHKVLSDDDYLIIGGDTGQDLKYNIHKRLYYAGVINSDKYPDIDYALLVYPIDRTYTGAPAWDYDYVQFIYGNSQQVFNKSYFGRRLVMLKITNHSVDGLASGEDFRKRSRESLKLA